MAKKRVQKPNEEYKLPRLVIPASSTLVLGMDPGSRNFGISLVGLDRGKVKVYANSVMMKPLDDLIDYGTSSDAFLKELKLWMAFKPKGMVAERFQTRGPGGPLIEYVGAMLGLMRAAHPKVWIKLTIASTWKNAFNKVFGTDLKEIYPTTRVQPHQLDATLIGIYGLEEMTGAQIDYDPDDIIRQVEATSLVKLRKAK